MSESIVHKNEDSKNYILSLAEKLKKHFDLYYEETREGEYFDLYAYHQQNFHKTFITRSTVYEGFSVYEHMLVRIVDNCNETVLSEFQDMLVRVTPLFAKPNSLHKRSVINGILICQNSVSEKLGNTASKFFFRQSYKFCFHGWSETMSALVSLADKKVYFPKRNKSLGKLLSF